jgi:ankyrin repeat protein
MKLLGTLPTSPQFYATFADDKTMLDYLIKKGANPNEVDGDGISALGWATIANRIDAVRVLLAKGARVNHVDNLGMTPLLYAASIDFGDTAVMETLIAAGADLNAKNKQGLTALDLARRYEHKAMVRLLSGKQASVQSQYRERVVLMSHALAVTRSVPLAVLTLHCWKK